MPQWFLKYKLPIGIVVTIIVILLAVGAYRFGARSQQGTGNISPSPTTAKPTSTPTPTPSEPTTTPKPTLKSTATPTPKPSSTPTPTNTPTPTPVTFSVTGATAAVSPTNYSGACPKKFDFTANITANTAGTVTYKWVRSDGGGSATQTMTFGSAGTQAASPSDWTLGGAGFSYSGWKKVEILTPNVLESNQTNFTLACSP